MGSDSDYNDWWDDLTIEQKRAAFELWQKSDIKSIFISENETDNTTHSNIIPPAHLFLLNNKPIDDHEEIRKQLASKVVWDQDRFKPHSTFRFTDKD